MSPYTIFQEFSAFPNIASLAPQERLPELPIIPREQHHTGAAAREYPRDAPVLTR